MKPSLYEAVCMMLLERFGEPIGRAPTTVGVPDEHELVEDDLVTQVAPPGGEKVVKALKKQKNIKNPWAVAWAMKKRGEI